MKTRTIGKFILRKAVRLVTLLFFLCVLTFTLLELSPIDPVTAYVGADPSIGAEQRELIAQHWGLDKPPAERFVSWFTSIAKGDWGTSMIYRRPVLEVIGTKFLTSLALMVTAWLLSGILGFWMGVLAGTHEGSPADRLIRLAANVLNSTPAFWTGMLLIMIFAVGLGWFPAALSVPIGVAEAEDGGAAGAAADRTEDAAEDSTSDRVDMPVQLSEPEIRKIVEYYIGSEFVISDTAAEEDTLIYTVLDVQTGDVFSYIRIHVSDGSVEIENAETKEISALTFRDLADQ